MSARLVLATMALLAAQVPVFSREQIPAEKRLTAYNAAVPTCNDSGVISNLQRRFSSKEEKYWNSQLEIVAVEKIQTAAFRPNGLDLIPRRYCSATVRLNNNRTTRVYYSMVESHGLLFNSYTLHFCVQGYDRNWSSAPNCRTARP